MSLPHLYSMKWDNYHSHVGDIFSQLLETGLMADVILYAEGEKINCHKMLLSACSPYFQEILSISSGSHTVVVVSGIPGEDVRSIIEFVYKGEINVEAYRFYSVLKAAEALKICGLMEVISHMSDIEDSDLIANVSNDSNQEEPLVNVSTNEKVKTKNNCERSTDKWMKIADVQNLNILEPDKSCSYVNNDIVKEESENRLGNISIRKDIHSSIYHSDNNNPCDGNLKVEPNDVICGISMDVISNSEEELQYGEIKSKQKKDKKKLYSHNQMMNALEDMKNGLNLVDAATKHKVPCTTLYVKARAAGFCANINRKEYPKENMIAALQLVANGASLQRAAKEYGIPKTVLWRRVRKSGDFTTLQNRISPFALSEIDSKETNLQEGVSITRVSPQYQIPKSNLFRWEKLSLPVGMEMERSELEDKSYKDDNDVNTLESFEMRNHLLNNEQNQCQHDSIKQNLFFKNDAENQSTSEDNFKITQTSTTNFDFSGDVVELPVSYVDNNQFPDSSIIILAPNQSQSSKYIVEEHHINEVSCISNESENFLHSSIVECVSEGDKTITENYVNEK